MSEQNVELVRRGLELLAAGDRDSLISWARRVADEDCELRSAIAGASTGVVYRGIAGLSQYLADVRETWERFDQVAEQFIDLQDNGVLVISRIEARGRASGVELERRYALHWRFKDGKLWRGVGYTDLDEARRTAGLA